VEQHGLQLHQNQQIPEQYLVQIPAKIPYNDIILLHNNYNTMHWDAAFKNDHILTLYYAHDSTTWQN
jgi:hypothetical protein